jgi:uncharacterized protein (DUF1501 family)
MDGCRDCNRTELLRRAVAEAGRGLPGIEPGMPLPAGTGMTRRRFVSGVAGLALGIYGGAALGGHAFDDGIARAAASGTASDGRILVSVFLPGGIDSLNVLFPAGEPAYYALRPSLALPQGSGLPYGEDDRLSWNPAAAGIATLHAEGKVSAIPAIGYADSDKSHFTSRHYWEVGATDASLRTGWLGRYVDATGAPDNPLQGLTLDVALQPAIASAKNPVAALQAADQYTFAPPGLPPHPLESSIVEEAANIGAAHARSRDAGLRTAGSVAVQANRVYQELTGFRGGFTSPVTYPASTDPFPHRLAGLAAMIAAGLPLGVVAITSPGRFDTHAAQAGTLQDGLQLTSDSLFAFQRDLEARVVADRVLVQVWSEFGRRAAENGSAGTDHGSAGIGFLIGTQVVGTQIGEFPGVTSGLDGQGNLVPTVDFRAVYGALVAQWLGADPALVIPGVSAYSLPTLIRA